jgi:hypothetical protein
MPVISSRLGRRAVTTPKRCTGIFLCNVPVAALTLTLHSSIKTTIRNYFTSNRSLRQTLLITDGLVTGLL